jgi:very-short-patch-repair endonuclease
VALDPVLLVQSAGSAMTTADLLQRTSRRALRTAVEHGRLVRVRRGRYALPGTAGAVRGAMALGGCASHLDAALAHGWGVLLPPTHHDVTVPPNRRGADATAGTALHWSSLTDEELGRGVTDPVRTVLDCARSLPLPHALAVADSALRSGVDIGDLRHAAASVRGPGAAAARRVARHADGRAANAFESGLRGLVLGAGFTGFQPQLVVAEPDAGLFAVVDLGDPVERVVLEADGYGVHGTSTAFAKDLARHDELQSTGWVTRRFAWVHVVRRGRWVVRQVAAAVDEARRRRPVRRIGHLS